MGRRISVKRIFALVIAVVLSMNLLFITVWADSDVQGGSNYFVVELEHNQILYKHNSDRQINSSLLNRLMVCMLALENKSITSLVTAKTSSISKDERFTIEANGQYSVDSLIKATILGGADNTARLLAEDISANSQEFVNLMNEKAEALGMKNTFFANADGSYNELSHTSLYDISLFMKYALKNMNFKNIINLDIALLWNNLIISNANKLVLDEEKNKSASGAMGYSDNNPSSSITSIFYIETDLSNSKANMRLLVLVVADSEEEYIQTSNLLLDNIANYFKRDLLVEGNQLVFEIAVEDESLSLVSPANVYCIMPIDQGYNIDKVSYSFLEEYNPETIKAPILAGTIIANAHFLLKDGNTIVFPIVAGNDITIKQNTVRSLLDRIKEIKEIYFVIISLIVLEILILLIKLVQIIRGAFK